MSLALIAAGIFLGFVVFGVWGDVLIGAVIVGTARLAEAASKSVSRGLRRTQRGLHRAPAERHAPVSLARAETNQR
jgi:hypothetical protein